MTFDKDASITIYLHELGYLLEFGSLFLADVVLVESKVNGLEWSFGRVGEILISPRAVLEDKSLVAQIVVYDAAAIGNVVISESSGDAVAIHESVAPAAFNEHRVFRIRSVLLGATKRKPDPNSTHYQQLYFFHNYTFHHIFIPRDSHISAGKTNYPPLMDFVNEKTFEKSPVCIFVDNGSLKPEAILALRRVAKQLAFRTNLDFHAAGLLHSDKVDASHLSDRPARVFVDTMQELLEEGHRDFLILPFFLGPSLGIVDWLPKKLEVFHNNYQGLKVKVAPSLFGGGVGAEPLATVINDRVVDVVQREGLRRPFVALVDHGTPAIAVNEVRERVAEISESLLGDKVAGLASCSMERRTEPEYDFNDPLLVDLLQDRNVVPAGDVVVALLFLSPGRHAGTGGDVEMICEEARRDRSDLRMFLTEPLGEHPATVDLLEQRVRECLDAD
jgi:sirohydrochlorin ferrochelatase